MAFRFRLEPLLRHRGFLRDRSRAALALAEARRREAKEALSTLDDETSRFSEACEEEVRGGLPAARYVALCEHLAHLRGLAVEAASELSEREAEAARARAHLLEAETAREVLSRVKDERREEWRTIEAARARRALDEAALTRAAFPARRPTP